jgi:hypothetical protein
MKFEIEPLVAEILDHLPESVWTSDSATFFDPAIGGGQFVRAIEQRLRAYGHNDANIRSRVFGFETSDLHIKFAVNKYKLVGQYIRMPYEQFLELDNNMKFDVVLGNPPYQSAHGVNSHALWEEFIEKSHTLVKDCGHVAMVTPYIGRRKIRKTFFENDFLTYRSIGVDKHFPGVGSTFCYHIVRNKKTGVITNADGIDHDLSRYDFVPSYINQEIIDILDEIMTGTPLNIKNGGVHSSNSSYFSDRQSKKFPFKYQHTSSQTKFCSKKCPAMDHKLKVVCSKSGYLKPWLDTNQIGITEGSWCIPVDTIEEGNKIINFLNSEKIKVFNAVSGSNTAAHDPNKYKLLCIK